MLERSSESILSVWYHCLGGSSWDRVPAMALVITASLVVPGLMYC